MPWHNWFVFDLGNVLIKLAYERVLGRICANASADRDRLLAIMESAGGYRDLERGAANFRDFHNLLVDKGGYRGSLAELRTIWADFFDGPMDGMEELLTEVRAKYRVAFLSNSNEVHAEVIPTQFPTLFRKDDRFIFSHVAKCAKPDHVIYHRALELLGAMPSQVIYVDDLPENVAAALEVGMKAFHFEGTRKLRSELSAEGLL